MHENIINKIKELTFFKKKLKFLRDEFVLKNTNKSK